MPVLLTTNKKGYFVQLCVEGKRYYLGAYGTRFKAEVIEREGLIAYEQGGKEALMQFQNTLNYKRVGARKQVVTRSNIHLIEKQAKTEIKPELKSVSTLPIANCQQFAVIKYLQNRNYVTALQLSTAIRMSEQDASYYLSELVKNGYANREGNLFYIKSN